MNASTNPYAGHRYPAEIIRQAVWPHFRFTLSLRDIEELLAARGLAVTYEAVRQWCLKFGQQFSKEIRRRQPVRASIAAQGSASEYRRARCRQDRVLPRGSVP